VQRLALVGSWPRTAEMLPLHRATGAASLLRTDWEMFLHVLAAANTGFGQEEAGRVAEFLATALEPASFVRWSSGMSTDDVSDLLRDIACPTLIVHYSGLHYLTMDMGRELASGIRNSRLLVVKAPPRMPREFEAAGNVVLEFLQEGEASAVLEVPSGTAVILFADIVDSTALTERMGDTAFRAKARELDSAMRTVTEECEGTTVEGKLVGDGVLAVFTSARQAIEAALRCGRAGESVGLPLHLGVHAGDVIREEGNVYGGAVNIAARIASAAAPGEVLVSDTVRGLARTSAGVSFENRGEHDLKGIAEPQRLFAVTTLG
jgi:class 3 adenylate cyclase